MPESNSMLIRIWRCILSPKLYRIYNIQQKRGPYHPNPLEKWSDTIIQALLVLWQVSLYASPIIAYSAYKRGYFSSEGHLVILKMGILGAAFLGMAFIIRALGRATNETYVEFNEKFRSIIHNYSPITKKELQNYEFDYTAWPVDFEYKNYEKPSSSSSSKCGMSCSGSAWCTALSSPSSFIGYLAIHSFGIKMIYPGSISALNYLIRNTLETGRKKFIEDKKADRYKLLSPDGNELDVMFVNQRNKTENGSKLVICTEGNAGFYEIGLMNTPLELGYSVLGWNHPGFGCSTGTPYPDNEKCAIDTVLQFAFQRLNFTPENIILFGWSIGGFASSYAVTLYPDIRAVILDATFDDLLPLAQKQMPAFLNKIVRATIRNHANLDVANQLIQYKGPILLIRRSEDEIISLIEGDMTTNRGNYLLLKILTNRYPKLITPETESAVWDWFAVSVHKKDLIFEKYNVDREACKSEYESYKSLHEKEYPMDFGEDFSSSKRIQMVLYLASIYMVDYPSSHCTTLPATMFHTFSEI